MEEKKTERGVTAEKDGWCAGREWLIGVKREIL